MGKKQRLADIFYFKIHGKENSEFVFIQTDLCKSSKCVTILKYVSLIQMKSIKIKIKKLNRLIFESITHAHVIVKMIGTFILVQIVAFLVPRLLSHNIVG